MAAVVVGSATALVQALGLVRWPFAGPELARRYVAAAGPDGAITRGTIEVVSATFQRLLGVGIGEHLGYLPTGVWTLLVAASVLSTSVLPGWFAILGIPIGMRKSMASARLNPVGRAPNACSHRGPAAPPAEVVTAITRALRVYEKENGASGAPAVSLSQSPSIKPRG